MAKTAPATFSFCSEGDFRLDFFTDCTMTRENGRVQICFEETLSLIGVLTTVSFNQNGIFFERKLNNSFEFLRDLDIGMPVQSAFLSFEGGEYESAELELGSIKIILFSSGMKIDFLPDGLSGELGAFAVRNERRSPNFVIKFKVKGKQ